VIDGRTWLMGWSVPELAEKATKLLGEPGTRTRLGEAGRERVLENFVITRHVQRYLAFFSSLLCCY